MGRELEIYIRKLMEMGRKMEGGGEGDELRGRRRRGGRWDRELDRDRVRE
jgi:hypothetical protein